MIVVDPGLTVMMMRSSVFMAIMVLTTVLEVTAKFHNSGTPSNIPPSFDCAARAATWEHGKKLLPGRGEFVTLFDAMQLDDGCNMTRPTTEDAWTPVSYPTPPGAIFVDATMSNAAETNAKKTQERLEDALNRQGSARE